MALLERYKVHDQTGSFKLTMPITWVKKNEVEHKDELDVIISESALIVLPPHEITDKEIEVIIRDFRAMVQIRNKMRLYQSMGATQD